MTSLTAGSTPRTTSEHCNPVRRRVKTGCSTCKIRKVKCDEGKPACQKCVSTGRQCDGYGIWGKGGNSYGSVQRAVATRVLRRGGSDSRSYAVLGAPSLPHIPELKGSDESLAFDYFRKYTIMKLPGFFESVFWDTLLLQACVQEPAVVHAVVALGAAHRDQGKLALKEYTVSIGHLRKELGKKGDDAIHVGLITCLVYICFELLRGDFNCAYKHLASGLQLLRELQTARGITPAEGVVVLRPNSRTIEDYLVEAFARLNVQTSLLDEPTTLLYHVGETGIGELTYGIPSEFTTLREARRHLDYLINGVVTLTHTASELASDGEELPEALRDQKERLEIAVANWHSVFESDRERLTIKGNLRMELGAPLLTLYYTMLKIMVGTCLRGTDEAIYDQYTHDFLSLVKLADKLHKKRIDSLKTPMPFGYHIPKIKFTADMGVIPPVYYAAMKCRVPSLRRRAIDLLKQAPHREGAWDSDLTSRVARYLMELEEGSHIKAFDRASLKGTFSSSAEHVAAKLKLVPPAVRINYATLALPNRLSRKATLLWKRFRADGKWDSGAVLFDVHFEVPNLEVE